VYAILILHVSQHYAQFLLILNACYDIRMRIVFVGSPEFAIPSLDALHEFFNVVGVITQPDRPAGRGRNPQPPAVKSYAVQHEIPFIQPRKVREAEVQTQLERWKADAAVVAAYGQILPASLLDIPVHGFINVHASLLPRWRGAAPVQAAILQGDTITGVTIMKMDPGMDTGPIISQSEVSIGDEETAGELLSRLSHVGAQLLIDTLPPYLEGKIEITPQNDQETTYAPLIHKTDGRFTPNQSAAYVARQVRAYEPWPGSYFEWDDKRVHVRKAHALPSNQAEIGSLIEVDEFPAIRMKEGVLVLDVLQISGKKTLPGDVFLRGARGFLGSMIELL